MQGETTIPGIMGRRVTKEGMSPPLPRAHAPPHPDTLSSFEGLGWVWAWGKGSPGNGGTSAQQVCAQDQAMPQP